MKSEIATYVNPSGLIAFTVSRLIAFDKCPGVCPIGVGEVIKKIVWNAILSVIEYDMIFIIISNYRFYTCYS